MRVNFYIYITIVLQQQQRTLYNRSRRITLLAVVFLALPPRRWFVWFFWFFFQKQSESSRTTTQSYLSLFSLFSILNQSINNDTNYTKEEDANNSNLSFRYYNRVNFSFYTYLPFKKSILSQQ